MLLCGQQETEYTHQILILNVNLNEGYTIILNLLPILGNTLLTFLGLLKQKNFLENRCFWELCRIKCHYVNKSAKLIC